MASRHEKLLEAGVRTVAIDVDSPQQHSAMIEKLGLPFPYLSDPDRSLVIKPYRVADPDDPRKLARPALVVIDPSGAERWRWVARDFADRHSEDDLLDVVRSLGLPSTDQAEIEVGESRPGPRAAPIEGLGFYFRGARFAAKAMGLRHGQLSKEIKDDSKAFVAEMDRFTAAYESLRRLRDDPTPLD